jgi:3-hydroxyisobutyrate dehydrogenase-like beta-hydroxyacid dehydrogenase
VPGVQADAPASNEYAPGFKVQFMRKDYNLAVEAAKLVDAKMYSVSQKVLVSLRTDTLGPPRLTR